MQCYTISIFSVTILQPMLSLWGGRGRKKTSMWGHFTIVPPYIMHTLPPFIPPSQIKAIELSIPFLQASTIFCSLLHHAN